MGYARIARENIIPAIQRSANSEFYALASSDPAKLADSKTRFQYQQAYGSYDELLKDPHVDAVYIPLPNSMHREWAMKAAEHGKHVLCEKPIALDAAECSEMMTAFATQGLLLMEAFMYRYTERTQKVLEVVRSGVLGEIKYINSTFRYLLTNLASIKLKPELGGGSLYDVGCYPVNFIGMVVDEVARLKGESTGTPILPESVSVECVREGEIDMLFSALLRYDGGLIAVVNSGFNAQKRVFSEIIGTKGMLEVPDTFFDNAGALTLTTGEERREIAVAASDRYRLEVEDFADAILNKRVPRLALTESLRNMEVIDWLQASAQ
jgi:D-xylose 1-dehydrogenase (NADP+, D-xylono-1,5-lactone-forming)